jgi:SAM-dependent methyltransferase
MSPTINDDPAVELPQVLAGRLPSRYGYPMQRRFLERLVPLLSPGVAILDVGAGRAPTLSPVARPADCRYVGMDISHDELRAAVPGSYDDIIVHDISFPLDRPFAPVDVIVSWQVLEHVTSTRNALTVMRGLLRPGGTLIVQVSGTFALFALAARLVPHRARLTLLTRLLGARAEEKFATRYDHCWASALERSLKDWDTVEVVPYYRGANYLSAMRPVQAAYLIYEDVLVRLRLRNLATHYLIIARS